MFFFSNLRLFFRSSFVQKMAENVSKTTEMAQRIQTNVYSQMYSIQREAKIRSRVTIQSSIENLQKQLRQQIARSLRNSESKVKFLIQKAQKEYNRLTQSHYKISQNQKAFYNGLISQCQKKRWQFMVHRQSCGFTINNYQLVHSLYVIPPRIG